MGFVRPSTLSARVRRVALVAIIAMVGVGCGDEGENLKMIDVSDLVMSSGGQSTLNFDCVPDLEVCNGLDDDCNGVVDDVTSLGRDPLNCGACGNACDLANVVATCLGGQCRVGRCDPGFVNQMA